VWNSIPGAYRFDSTASGIDAVVEELDETALPGHGRKLRCRACQNVITDEGQRVSIDGEHVHSRVNPAGISFCFGCFRSAPGCSALGVASEEFSWFTGCRWKVAVCSGCGDHLGWSFNGSRSFYGLILARLVADEEKPH